MLSDEFVSTESLTGLHPPKQLSTEQLYTNCKINLFIVVIESGGRNNKVIR